MVRRYVSNSKIDAIRAVNQGLKQQEVDAKTNAALADLINAQEDHEARRAGMRASGSSTPLLDQKMGITPGMSRLERINALGKSLNGYDALGGQSSFTNSTTSPPVDTLASFGDSQEDNITGVSSMADGGEVKNNWQKAVKDRAAYLDGIIAGGNQSTPQPKAPAPQPDAPDSSEPSGFDRKAFMKDLYGYSGGGEIDGPAGDDQVAAMTSDGRPARLEDGEVVLPKKFVHQLGVQAIQQAVERVTGRKMDPAVKEPLAGQEGSLSGPGVLAAADGMAEEKGQNWIGKYVVPIIEEEQQAQAAPTTGTKLHHILKQADMVRTIPQRVIGDVAKGTADGIYDFGKEVVTGTPNPTSTKPKETFEIRSPGTLDKLTGNPEDSPQAMARAAADLQRRNEAERPKTEAELLTALAPEGRTISRNGQVFRMQDTTEKRPGYSGVTFSDTVEGLGLGQKEAPRMGVEAVAALRDLYKAQAKERVGQQVARGVTPSPRDMWGGPAVTEAERGANLRDISRAETQQAKMEKAAAQLKPADVLKQQELGLKKQEFEQNQTQAQRKEIKDLAQNMSSFTPLSQPEMEMALGDLTRKGYGLDDILSIIYSSNWDEKITKAFGRQKEEGKSYLPAYIDLIEKQLQQ